MKQNDVITKSAEETQGLGEKLAASLKSGDVLALHGNLGSGKTTFVQGLAKGLGISQRIISPTFIIMRSYTIKKFRSKDDKPLSEKMFYHVDLYRIRNATDIEGLGLQEIMEDKHAIVVIEWAEKIEKFLPKQTKRIYFTYRNEHEREIMY